MNSEIEAEIKSFLYAKINNKNFADLFKEKIKLYRARSSENVYTACKLLHEFCNKNNKLSLILQVYCDQLMFDINHLFEVEHDVSLSPTDGIKAVLQIQQMLSKRYTLLAKLMESFPEAERESLLTAFSLNPNLQTFEKVQNCAKELWPTMNSENIDLTIDHNQREHKTRRQIKIEQHVRGLCININNNNVHYDPSALPVCLYDNSMLQKCISKELAHDLINIINVLRNKTLFWSVAKWSQLEEKCVAWMDNAVYRIRHIEMNLAHSTKLLKYYDLSARQLEVMVFNRRVDQLQTVINKANRRTDEPRFDEEQQFLGFEKITATTKKQREIQLKQKSREVKLTEKCVKENVPERRSIRMRKLVSYEPFEVIKRPRHEQR